MLEAQKNSSMRHADSAGKSVESTIRTGGDSTRWESVWRVVFPNPADPDARQTLPLYVTSPGPYHTPPEALDERLSSHVADLASMSTTQICTMLADTSLYKSPSDFDANKLHLSRTSCTIPAGTDAGLCTYFNAFPASYWRFWTKVRHVRFSVHARGQGTITLFKSNCRGLSSPVGRIAIDTNNFHKFSATIPLTGVIDGGWIWADICAGSSSSLTIADASWQVPASARTARKPGMASVVITTFNREKYCLRQLRILEGAQSLLKRVSAVRCVDQGTHPVIAQPGFAKIKSELGEKLQYLRQPNLGGSGGFSRGMIETLDAKDGSSALLLDDDAIIEPESLLRAIQFEDYARMPLIVGAGMLHLDDRSVLYTQAERLNPATLLHEQYVTNHDFAIHPLATSPRLHRRVSSGYNGWWMSLIPAAAMRKIGFALPNFIKFDDVDYSARAKEHGFPTVSLPGVAIWHEAWHGKNESRSWQEYYNQRNRYLYALVHEPRANRRVSAMLLRHCTAMGLSFIYSGIAQDEMALTDLLRGPKFLIDSYPTTMKRIANLRSRFADTKPLPEGSPVPLPTTAFEDVEAHPLARRALSRLSRKAALSAWLHPRSGAHDEKPATEVDSAQTDWKSFLGINSALVAAPDANSVSWLRRDDRLYRHLTWQVLRLGREIVRNWPKLHKEYTSANLGSRQMWERIFRAAKTRDFR